MQFLDSAGGVIVELWAYVCNAYRLNQTLHTQQNSCQVIVKKLLFDTATL